MKSALSEQIKCVIREIGLRKRVYPNWIAANRMKAIEAERQILIMEDVLDTLKMVSWMKDYEDLSYLWDKYKEELKSEQPVD